MGNVTFNAVDKAMDSATATLTVSAAVKITRYAARTINCVSQTCGIQSLTNLNNQNTWVSRTNISRPTPIFLWHDTQPTTTQTQSYRVVPGSIFIPYRLNMKRLGHPDKKP